VAFLRQNNQHISGETRVFVVGKNPVELVHTTLRNIKKFTKKMVSMTSKNQGIFMKFIRGRQEFKFLLKFL